MAAAAAAAARFLIAVAAVASAVAVCGGFPATMTLERAFPVRGHADVSQLIARDRARHGRMLQSSTAVVDFPVDGTFNPFLVGYFLWTFLFEIFNLSAFLDIGHMS